MPVPGPRTQSGPVAGYRNPTTEEPDRINRWNFPRPTQYVGRSPGTMVLTLRGMRLAPGQVRHLYKQKVDLIAGGRPLSWSRNSPTPGWDQGGFEITRAWRYMIQSRYLGSGDNSARWGGVGQPRHVPRPLKHINPTPTVGAGNKSRARPTVRNRLTSFGSRVPVINDVLPASSTPPDRAQA